MNKFLIGVALLLSALPGFSQGVKLQPFTTNTAPVVTNIVISLSSNLQPNRLQATNTVLGPSVYTASSSTNGYWTAITNITGSADGGYLTNNETRDVTFVGAVTLEDGGGDDSLLAGQRQLKVGALVVLDWLNSVLGGTWIGNGAGFTNIQEASLVHPAANPSGGLVLTSTSSNTAAWLPASAGVATNIYESTVTDPGLVLTTNGLLYEFGLNPALSALATNSGVGLTNASGKKFLAVANDYGTNETWWITSTTRAPYYTEGAYDGPGQQFVAQFDHYNEPIWQRQYKQTGGGVIDYYGGRTNSAFAFTLGTDNVAGEQPRFVINFIDTDETLKTQWRLTTNAMKFANGDGEAFQQDLFKQRDAWHFAFGPTNNASGINAFTAKSNMLFEVGAKVGIWTSNSLTILTPFQLGESGLAGQLGIWSEIDGVYRTITADESTFTFSAGINVGNESISAGNYFGGAIGLTNIQEAALVYPAANPAAGLVLTSTSSNTAAWLAPTGGSGSATNAVSQIMTNGVALGTGITNLNFVDGANTTVTGWVSGASVNIGVSSSGGGGETTNHWKVTGNSGLLTTDFIGTTDNRDFVIKVNSKEVGRFYSTVSGGTASAINIGTFNSVSDANGSFVAGANQAISTATYATLVGGQSHYLLGGENPAGSFATIVGGYNNTNIATGSFIGGGYQNRTSASNSIAMGFRAHAAHSGSTVFSDLSNNAWFQSATSNEFSIRASGGFRVEGGTMIGNGNGLTNGLVNFFTTNSPTATDEIIQSTSATTAKWTPDPSINSLTVQSSIVGNGAGITNLTLMPTVITNNFTGTTNVYVNAGSTSFPDQQWTVVLTNSTVLSITNAAKNGQTIFVNFIQDTTGGRQVYADSTISANPDMPIPSGGSLSLVTTASSEALLRFKYSSHRSKWLLIGNLSDF